MFHIFLLQYVMPPVEVEEDVPPIWYAEDSMKAAEAWEALYSFPGLIGYSYGSFADMSGVSVKGGHPKGTAVYLEGLLINQPQGGYADLSDISTFLFSRAEVWEGGTTPYSIYGNLNFKYVPDTSGYVCVGSEGSLRGGAKLGGLGVDAGRATRGKGVLLYAEGFWTGKYGKIDVRIARKRTSGMDDFPSTSGLQEDLRVAAATPVGSILLLSREWEDWTGRYVHRNFRLSRNVSVRGLLVGLALEGVKSTNVGSHLRPILSVGKDAAVGNLYISGGIWTDTRRLGYSAAVGFRKDKAYAQLLLSNRIPSFDELFWEGYMARGNPDLRNEKSFGGSVGWISDILKLDLFYRRMYDLIEWEPVRGIWMPKNVPGGRVWGWSLGLRYGWLSLKYDRLWAYDDEGHRLIYRPRNTYHVRLSPSLGPVSLALEGTYIDPRFTNRANTRFVNYVLLIEPSLAYSLGRLSVVVSVFNLLNGRYEFVEGYTLPGRSVSLTLHLR
ncbi:MAG: hypothetical protein GXO29_05975 [Thermotogae bacterium]|nr:hypothetical protein [Thermotogota bacterium]